MAALLALAFAGALLVRAGGDPSLLVHAGAPCATRAASPATTACDASVPVASAQPDRMAPDGPATSSDDLTPGRRGAPGSLTVQSADEAFDGQFFYRLAVSPWSRDQRVAGVQYDLPALRNARWGYGALAFVASGGDRDLVPWSLLGLNIAAAAAVGAIGGGLARSSGRHAAWGVLFALWPGFAYSLSLDTSELVASAFALAAILALRRRRWVWAAAALAAAVVTRDTTAALAGGLLLGAVMTWWTGRKPVVASLRVDSISSTSLSASGGSASGAQGGADVAPSTPTDAPHVERDPGFVSGNSAATALPISNPRLDARSMSLTSGAAALVGLVAFGAWQLVQRARFGVLPITSSGDNNLSTPLAGFVDGLRAVVPPSGGDEAFRLLAMAAVVGLLGLAAWCWRASTTPLMERVAWVPAVAVVVLLNAYLWSGATAFLRAGTEAGLLSILVLLGSRRDRLVTLAGVGLAGMWLLTAAGQLTKLG